MICNDDFPNLNMVTIKLPLGTLWQFKSLLGYGIILIPSPYY